MYAMLCVHLPCSHLYSNRKTFPNLRPPKLNMVNWFKNELFFEYTVLPSLRIEVNADYYERVRKYVYKTKNGIATTKTRKN